WPTSCARASFGRTRSTSSTRRRRSAATRSPATGARAAGTVWRRTLPESARLAVRKTYKLYIGGKFPRSESGRSYLVQGSNVALASRKDVRDAVVAARAAVKGWSGATAYNRGQILYRAAEMLEGRRAQFV